MTETILDDSAVEEILWQYKHEFEPTGAYHIPALCATVKHLRAENEALRKEVANSEKYQAQLLDSDSQPLGDAVCLYVPPIDATELHLMLLCRDCGKPFSEHWQPPVTAPPEAPLRYWVELRSQHAFPVRPQPFVETVEYIRFDLARTSAVPRVEKLEIPNP